MPNSLDTLCVNTIRTLAMDAVQQANSGHPGTPMAMAPVAYTLWQRRMRFDPNDPIWPNRDRFVLSMGHASMLLYSVLHLVGVKAVNAEYSTEAHTSTSTGGEANPQTVAQPAPATPAPASSEAAPANREAQAAPQAPSASAGETVTSPIRSVRSRRGQVYR